MSHLIINSSDLFKNETSVYCFRFLSVIESFTYLIRQKTLIDSGTPLLCVNVVHSAVALSGTLFVDGSKVDKATDNTVSKI